MIAVKITLKVLPEKQLEVMQTLLSLIDPVGKEPGCRSYRVSCDIDDKNSFCLMEEWETLEDLNYHIKSFRFGVLLGTKILLRKSLKIQIYTVAQVQGMEVVEELRNKKVL